MKLQTILLIIQRRRQLWLMDLDDALSLWRCLLSFSVSAIGMNVCLSNKPLHQIFIVACIEELWIADINAFSLSRRLYHYFCVCCDVYCVAVCIAVWFIYFIVVHGDTERPLCYTPFGSVASEIEWIVARNVLSLRSAGIMWNGRHNALHITYSPGCWYLGNWSGTAAHLFSIYFWADFFYCDHKYKITNDFHFGVGDWMYDTPWYSIQRMHTTDFHSVVNWLQDFNWLKCERIV